MSVCPCGRAGLSSEEVLQYEYRATALQQRPAAGGACQPTPGPLGLMLHDLNAMHLVYRKARHALKQQRLQQQQQQQQGASDAPPAPPVPPALPAPWFDVRTLVLALERVGCTQLAAELKELHVRLAHDQRATDSAAAAAAAAHALPADAPIALDMPTPHPPPPNDSLSSSANQSPSARGADVALELEPLSGPPACEPLALAGPSSSSSSTAFAPPQRSAGVGPNVLC